MHAIRQRLVRAGKIESCVNGLKHGSHLRVYLQ